MEILFIWRYLFLQLADLFLVLLFLACQSIFVSNLLAWLQELLQFCLFMGNCVFQFFVFRLHFWSGLLLLGLEVLYLVL